MEFEDTVSQVEVPEPFPCELKLLSNWQLLLVIVSSWFRDKCKSFSFALDTDGLEQAGFPCRHKSIFRTTSAPSVANVWNMSNFQKLQLKSINRSQAALLSSRNPQSKTKLQKLREAGLELGQNRKRNSQMVIGDSGKKGTVLQWAYVAGHFQCEYLFRVPARSLGSCIYRKPINLNGKSVDYKSWLKSISFVVNTFPLCCGFSKWTHSKWKAKNQL